MQREIPPFRADHVGSLLRPAELKQARARHQSGSIDDFELRAAEDRAIRAAASAGLEACDIEEILLQLALYAGLPAANTGFQIAAEELARN